MLHQTSQNFQSAFSKERYRMLVYLKKNCFVDSKILDLVSFISLTQPLLLFHKIIRLFMYM